MTWRGRALGIVVIVGIGALIAARPRSGDEPPGAAQAAEGRILVLRNATSELDAFLRSAGPRERRRARGRYWRMRGYPPAFDRALRWAPPSHAYLDLYAIYRSRGAPWPGPAVLRRHPDWVLRDRRGRPLHIPFRCRPRCPQFAADIGNAAWQARWIARARNLLERGYAGIFVDDVNGAIRVSDAAGRPARPIDPRTGTPMTRAAWRRYLAAFAERVRRALPEAEIVHNVIWYEGHRDPALRRQLLAADWVQLERGYSDPGLTPGRGRFSLRRLLRFVDWIHAQGRGVITEPYERDRAERRFELAMALLVNEGRDAIAARLGAGPERWWRGWETDLGPALGGRYEWRGLQRRDFERGVVLVNLPGAPAAEVEVPPGRLGPSDTGGPIRLGPGDGAILLADRVPGLMP